MALKFETLTTDVASYARTGRVTTPHGSFDTPAFMPVGTQAAIKGLGPDTVAELGTSVILANTYHLMLRPGSDLVAQMGGLHRWMRWDGPILTDSGGYQVFSLANISRVTDQGVWFRSHVDGTAIELSPEASIRAQNELGADIIMALDDCPPAPESLPPTTTYTDRIATACQRSVVWLDRCVRAHRRDDQALFGIVQGGIDLQQRTWCAERVCQHQLPGYAIGGVAVGEGHEGLRRAVEHTAALLPADRPRYLMGVGYEKDILTAVRAGVDMFDCVLPTRNGRNSSAFTPTGLIRLRNRQYRSDGQPIDPACDCPACGGGFSRSYLRHLFISGEMLGPILVSAHNIRHFQRFLLDIRQSITDNAASLIPGRWPVVAGSET